jgi:hypothetical protein
VPAKQPAVDRLRHRRQNRRIMIIDFLTALLKAGVPVGLMAWALTWWALRNGHLGDVEGLRDVEREVKRLSKDKQRKKDADLVHRKWLMFGGGFYGVVAFLTLLIIEGRELWDFFTSFPGIMAFFEQLSLNMLIGLFVEAIKNSFLAIAWPVYWMSDFRGGSLWLWFLAAYAGYWGGSSVALRQYHAARTGGSRGDD